MVTLLEQPLLIHAAMFIAAASAVLLVFGLFRVSDARITERIAECGPKPVDAKKLKRSMSMLERMIHTTQIAKLAAHLVPNDEQLRSKLQKRLMQAGVYSPRASYQFFAIRLALMVAPPLVGSLLGFAGVADFRYCVWWGSLAGGIGLLAPGLCLDRMKVRRQRVLRAALPDFLDLFVACVESGLTMQAAIGEVAAELKRAHPALAGEFAVLLRQVEFGTPLESAMRDLAERTDLDELRSVSTFVQQSQRFGATMASALRELADGLRLQRELRAEERAQKAAVHILIPTLLFIFPAVFVVLAGPAAIRVHETMTGKAGQRPTAP